MSEENKSRICLSKDVNEVRVEVWLSEEDEIRSSIYLLEQISQRIPIEQNRFRSEYLWNITSGKLTLDKRITNPGHRMVLSLLYNYPNPRKNAELMEECNLSKDEVYNYLTGRNGDMKDWFTSVEKGVWILSRFGESKIAELVDSISQIIK